HAARLRIITPATTPTTPPRATLLPRAYPLLAKVRLQQALLERLPAPHFRRDVDGEPIGTHRRNPVTKVRVDDERPLFHASSIMRPAPAPRKRRTAPLM